MEEYLNYLQEKGKMIREFKFFHGLTIQTEGIQNIVRTLRAQWRPDLADDLITNLGLDSEVQLTRILSEEIAREIDENIVRQITTDWNGGQRA
jgi:hypothetical protein